MVNGIPIYKVDFAEGLLKREFDSSKTFGYCIEANKGPVGEPIYISSNSEAMRIFGVNFAPHFYQKGTGIKVCRVEFPGMTAPSLTYKAKVADSGDDTVDVLKVTGTTPGTAQHQVNIVKSPTSSKAYNLTVTIEGVGSKKYQNLSSLANVVKKINSKFADYITAELLIDETQALALESTESLVKNSDGTFSKKQTSEVKPEDDVVCKGTFNASRLQQNITDGVVDTTLSGGSNGKLRKTDGTISNLEIPSSGIKEGMPGTGTGNDDPNVETTLLYAYRDAFKIMEDLDLLGVATLSPSEVVQNELVEHINEMIDPEVYKYRLGCTGFLDYPGVDSHGNTNATEAIDISNLVDSTPHIDNPFIVMVGQGVVFEEDNVKYNLLPHEAVMLYTGLRSSLSYKEAIFGGNSKKVLIGVKDVLPLVTDGSILTKEDIESVNEAGLMTFKKEYGEVTFLEGVTTAQDNPVLSHESVMMIVINVLKRLIRVSKPFQGENVTEDLKSSLVTALNNELKNITDTDGSLVALKDYNIPPYAVEVQATIIAGFNDAGEYIRESHYLVTVKIVPVGALRSITLSVIVI